MRKALILFFPIVATYGALNMIVSALVAFCFISPDMEMPIIGVTDYKKHEDSFYIASSFNSRVNVYDLNGDYVKRHSILNYAKPFRFRMSDDGRSIDFSIIPQGMKNVHKPSVRIHSGMIEYRFQYRSEVFVVEQNFLTHLLFNPILGIAFCFVGILGTLATSAWLRNKLFLNPRR